MHSKSQKEESDFFHCLPEANAFDYFNISELQHFSREDYLHQSAEGY